MESPLDEHGKGLLDVAWNGGGRLRVGVRARTAAPERAGAAEVITAKTAPPEPSRIPVGTPADPSIAPQLRIDPTIEGDSTNAQDARDCREAEKGRLERPFDFQQISLTEENRQTNENP